MKAVAHAGIVLAILTQVSAAWGCAGGAGSPPRRTLSSFVAEVEAGRYAEAYALLDEDYRRRVPLQRFATYLRTHPEEVRQWVLLVRHAPDEARVVYRLGGGDEIALRWENGGWRVEAASLDFYARGTPRAAVRAFVRALERRRWGVLLALAPRRIRRRLTPRRLREAWMRRGEEALRRWIAALHEALEAPVERHGEVATVAYGEGRMLRLVREDGTWCVESPE